MGRFCQFPYHNKLFQQLRSGIISTNEAFCMAIGMVPSSQT